ncbi:MAG: DUF1800 domain-containing protein [Flavimaricola sp.]|nr:DUF1800 domain-containing protein [Flavimaricola sp.]
MSFDPYLAEIRFGTGLSPNAAPPASSDAILAALRGPDLAAEAFPIPLFSEAEPRLKLLRRQAAMRRESDAAMERFAASRNQASAVHQNNFRRILTRGVRTHDGFRERLTAFWANHFPLRAKIGPMTHLVTPFVEEAIRPNITGRFADLLKAVATHPMMVIYLDQGQSVGPGSPFGTRTGRGLNENLARELLELHTLGVGNSYDQSDIRQLAELLTGLSWDDTEGRVFQTNWAEPGSETVLGRTYSDDGSLETIFAALEDIAAHPSTAHHIATKIARHFVSDTPSTSLIEAMAAAYSANGTDLMSVYSALLDHPDAWLRYGIDAPVRNKARTHQDWVQAALRALDIALVDVAPDVARTYVLQRLRLMGQPWEQPPGPDGWPEEAEAWVTPPAMAARVTWAMQAPSFLMADLPDPRDFVAIALGPFAPPEVKFAAGAAENRAAGIGMVLCSSAFQRR